MQGELKKDNSAVLLRSENRTITCLAGSDRAGGHRLSGRLEKQLIAQMIFDLLLHQIL